MIQLMQGLQSILESVEAIKPGQSVLVLGDNEGASVWLSQVVTNVVTNMGSEPILMYFTPTSNVAQEPPAPVAAAVKVSNTCIHISDMWALGHTTARKEAAAAGNRLYSINQIPLEDLKQGVKKADIQLIRDRTEKVAQILTEGSEAHVTTALGTDIKVSLMRRKGNPLHPLNKTGGGLPYYAEVAISPVEGTAEGTIVADLEVVNWGNLLQEPLCFTVKGGRIKKLTGGKQTGDKLRDIIAKNENADNIAELGIGTSHIISLPLLGTRRDAARLGTAHFGVGRSDVLGGTTWSPIHLDGLMSEPTVEIDGKCIMRDGKLLI